MMNTITIHTYLHRLSAIVLCSLLVFGCIYSNANGTELIETVDETNFLFEDFLLEGHVHDKQASFKLTGVLTIHSSKTTRVPLLTGNIALTEIPTSKYFQIELTDDTYWLTTRRKGQYPLDIKFNTQITQLKHQHSFYFSTLNAALKKMRLYGISQDSTFNNTHTTQPVFEQDHFSLFLSSQEPFSVSWKAVSPASEAKPFYAVDITSEMTLSPGIVQQHNLLQLAILQGEIDTLNIALEGPGNVNHVEGPHILNWEINTSNIESNTRILSIRFNQKIQQAYALQIFLQAALEPFPVTLESMKLIPLDTIRTSGHLRIRNQGAVRVELKKPQGITQISPQQFPLHNTFQSLEKLTGKVSAFRFSGIQFQYQLSADNILPEVSVSQVTHYRLADNNTAIHADIELDIREAPIRELHLHIPKDYAIAQINIHSLNDYFTREIDEQTALLRIQFNQPLQERQLLKLKLENNKALQNARFALPKVQVSNAKSTRGYVGISASEGNRISIQTSQGLSEMAAAFFPKPEPGLQLAFRQKNKDWQATVEIEKLDQSIQADALHLFSIGENMLFGSSVIHYHISGAPVSALQFEVPESYNNLEFSGGSIRNWRKEGTRYTLSLESPQSGLLTLLVTYDRPFDLKGESIDFQGITPSSIHSEQGHILIVSNAPFKLDETNRNPALLKQELNEIPDEYRLLFDAPLLASYQYAQRPIVADLQLVPLTQGNTLKQVVEYAKLDTHVSAKGETVTAIKYLLKSKGHTHFKLQIPPHTQLWTAKVNDQKVTPIVDQAHTLIPLPQAENANTLITVELEIAQKSDSATNIALIAPSVHTPIVLTDWQIHPENNYTLNYTEGNIHPVAQTSPYTGIDWALQLVSKKRDSIEALSIVAALVIFSFGCFLIRRTSQEHTEQATFMQTSFKLFGICCMLTCFALLTIVAFKSLVAKEQANSSLQFSEPIQLAQNALSISFQNVKQGSILWHQAETWFIALSLGLLTFSVFAQKHYPRSLKPLLKSLSWSLFILSLLLLPHGHFYSLIALSCMLFCSGLLPALSTFSQIKPISIHPAAKASTTFTIIILTALALENSSLEASPITEGFPAQSIVETIHLNEHSASITAHYIWKAKKGEHITFLSEPALLTDLQLNTKHLKLVTATDNLQTQYQLKASKSGRYAFDIQYEVPINEKHPWRSLILPVSRSLIHTATLHHNLGQFETNCQEAITTETLDSSAASTSVQFRFHPNKIAHIQWKPKTRNTQEEDVTYYANIKHLFIPTSGVVEGYHLVDLKPAQGEVKELNFKIPESQIITDVSAPFLATWNYEASQSTLELHFLQNQSEPFQIKIQSQIKSQALPYTTHLKTFSLPSAAGEVGLIGIGTRHEAQIGATTHSFASKINIDDFPLTNLNTLCHSASEIKLTHAFRYSDPQASLEVEAIAVEPDIRIQTQETISVGEDQIVYGIQAEVNITRTGVFQLTFPLDKDLEIESISGSDLSQWILDEQNEKRLVTLHLNQKTLGTTKFSISLVGSGILNQTQWQAPSFKFSESNKQTGQLTLTPEQGLRLHLQERKGLTQIDAKTIGIQYKGTLAFRLLQADRLLHFDVEHVQPWLQSTTLHAYKVRQGMIDVQAIVEYTIENAGIKELNLKLPQDSAGIKIQGKHITDIIKQPNGHRTIKLQRKILGKYTLHVTFQHPLNMDTQTYTLKGIETQGMHLERGYLTLGSQGRIQTSIAELPTSLQNIEWQNIPQSLRSAIKTPKSHQAFRILKSDYTLTLKLENHATADLLKAKVENITIDSIFSERGIVISRVNIQLIPNDKRYLKLKLPTGAKFWYAFVNQESVWPWQEGDQLLLQLSENAFSEQTTQVELIYTTDASSITSNNFASKIVGPQFDLPLEAVTWNLYLPESWELEHWAGTLNLQEHQQSRIKLVNEDFYLEKESQRLATKTNQAESLLSIANDYLEDGNQQKARKAFSSAYKRSRHDSAFNEDTRIQLQNLKQEQALMWLNNRTEHLQNNVAMQSPIINQPIKTDSALQLLAERLVAQQDAANAMPEAIHASIPEKGKHYQFTRSLFIDDWADLELDLRTVSSQQNSYWIWGVFALLLFGGSWSLQWIRLWR